MKTFTLLLFMPLLSLAKPTLIPTAMFDNAIRRDASEQEKSEIVKLKINYSSDSAGRCTGYFVKNENDRFFIATAQHCGNYDFTKYCNSTGIHVSTASGDHKGYCESVIISHEKSDFVIFEARFLNPDVVKQSVKFLTLADAVPEGGSSLKLIGYPGDEERKGQLTVTEKCSVIKTERTAMQQLTKEDLEHLSGGKKTTPAPQKTRKLSPEAELTKKRALDIKMSAVKKLHNCSIYGGNSGGPLLIHGTDIVIGMPMTYLKLPVTRKFSEDSGIYFETTQSVIEKNRRAFEDYKIITTKNLGLFF